MADPATIVLVHSPFLGPAALRPLAEAISSPSQRAVVLDLLPSVAAPPVHQRLIGAFADACAEAELAGPLLLVGHGAAGPLLPAFADQLEDVAGLIYLDAELPTPGESARDRDPVTYERLRAISRGGLLPRWTEWGEPDPLERVGSRKLRRRIAEEAPEVALAYLKETRPSAEWTGPTGYLGLSREYDRHLAVAHQRGWPALGLGRHHLACATDPRMVELALLEIADLLPATAG